MKRFKATLLHQIFSLTFPVLLGYLPLGAAFGVLLVKSGYPWYLAPMMAVIMYAGSGQLLAVSFFSADAGYPEIALATAMMQLRHSFYGLSLLVPFSTFSKSRFYMMHALTDETYAVLTGAKILDDETRESRFFLISLFDHVYWVIGCTIGAIAGSIIPSDMKGLDFALTSLFVVLAVEKWIESETPMPAFFGVISSLLAIALFGRAHMLIGAIGIAVIVLMLYGWRRDARL